MQPSWWVCGTTHKCLAQNNKTTVRPLIYILPCWRQFLSANGRCENCNIYS